MSGFDMTPEETADFNGEGRRLLGLSWAGLPKGEDNPRLEGTPYIHRLLRLHETKHLAMSQRAELPPHDDSYFS